VFLELFITVRVYGSADVLPRCKKICTWRVFTIDIEEYIYREDAKETSIEVHCAREANIF
jgi:hypothetical protein